MLEDFSRDKAFRPSNWKTVRRVTKDGAADTDSAIIFFAVDDHSSSHIKRHDGNLPFGMGVARFFSVTEGECVAEPSHNHQLPGPSTPMVLRPPVLTSKDHTVPPTATAAHTTSQKSPQLPQPDSETGAGASSVSSQVTPAEVRTGAPVDLTKTKGSKQVSIKDALKVRRKSPRL